MSREKFFHKRAANFVVHGNRKKVQISHTWAPAISIQFIHMSSRWMAGSREHKSKCKQIKEQKRKIICVAATYRSFINHANRLLPSAKKFLRTYFGENHTREPNVCQLRLKMSTMKYLFAVSNMRLTNRRFSLSKLGKSHALSAHQVDRGMRTFWWFFKRIWTPETDQNHFFRMPNLQLFRNPV